MSQGPTPAKPPDRLPASVYFAGMLAGAVAGGLYLVVANARADQPDGLTKPAVSGAFLGVVLGTASGPVAAWVVRQRRARGMAARLVLGMFAGLATGAVLMTILSGAMAIMLSSFLSPQQAGGDWLSNVLVQNAPRGGLIGLIAGLVAVGLDRPPQPEQKDGPTP